MTAVEPVAMEVEGETARLQVEPARGEFEPARGEVEAAGVEVEPAWGKLELAGVELEAARVELELPMGELEIARVELEPARGELEVAMVGLEAPEAEAKPSRVELVAPLDFQGCSLDETVLKMLVMDKEGVTNRLVLYLLDKNNKAVHQPLMEVVARVLGWHRDRLDRKAMKRLRHYLCSSVSNHRGKMEEQLDGPWLYLEWMQEGGVLFRPELLLPPPSTFSFPGLQQRIREVLAAETMCAHCGAKSYMVMCSCTTAFYCGAKCRSADREHSKVCLVLEEQQKEGGMLLSAATIHHKGRANRLAGLLGKARRQVKVLELELETKRKVVARQDWALQRLRRKRREGFRRGLTVTEKLGGRKTATLCLKKGQEAFAMTKVDSLVGLNVWEGVNKLPLLSDTDSDSSDEEDVAACSPPEELPAEAEVPAEIIQEVREEVLGPEGVLGPEETPRKESEEGGDKEPELGIGACDLPGVNQQKQVPKRQLKGRHIKYFCG